MSHPPAKMRDGSPYNGNVSFLGNGYLRSCGKCKKHKSSGGSTKHRLYGWVCKECATAQSKPD